MQSEQNTPQTSPLFFPCQKWAEGRMTSFMTQEQMTEVQKNLKVFFLKIHYIYSLSSLNDVLMPC